MVSLLLFFGEAEGDADWSRSRSRKRDMGYGVQANGVAQGLQYSTERLDEMKEKATLKNFVRKEPSLFPFHHPTLSKLGNMLTLLLSL